VTRRKRRAICVTELIERKCRSEGRRNFSVHFLPHLERIIFAELRIVQSRLPPSIFHFIFDIRFREFYSNSFLSIFISSLVIIDFACCIRQLSSRDLFFFYFGSGESLNRARWHNGRSRQSPTCYHIAASSELSSQGSCISYALRRALSGSSRCENRATRDAIGEMGQWFRLIGHSNAFEFLQCNILINEMKIFSYCN